MESSGQSKINRPSAPGLRGKPPALLFAVFFHLFLFSNAESLSITRGPYLQQTTPQSVIVRWRTDTESDSEVKYGAFLGSYNASVRDSSLTTEHEIKIRGLNPDTKYYYTAGSADEQLTGYDEESFFFTAPAKNSSASARIWVIGDPGTGNSTQISVRDAYYTYSESRAADLILTLGDNAYSEGSDSEYQRKFFDVYKAIMKNTAVWCSFSNHDTDSDSTTQSGPYYDSFSFPTQGEAGGVASGGEAYYSFNFGDIHFVSLDSYDSSRQPEGDMLLWLRQDLAAAKQKWIIVFWHHPPYSFGSHNSDYESKMSEMRENVVPIIDKYGADLVLTGHSHSYERSMLIKGHYGASDTFTSKMAVDSGDGRPNNGVGAYQKTDNGSAPAPGTVYIVAGTSGRTGSVEKQHPVMIATSIAPGSLVIDINGDELNVVFLDYTGKALDSFTILKSD